MPSSATATMPIHRSRPSGRPRAPSSQVPARVATEKLRTRPPTTAKGGGDGGWRPGGPGPRRPIRGPPSARGRVAGPDRCRPRRSAARTGADRRRDAGATARVRPPDARVGAAAGGGSSRPLAAPEAKITGRTGRMHGEIPVTRPPRNPTRTEDDHRASLPRAPGGRGRGVRCRGASPARRAGRPRGPPPAAVPSACRRRYAHGGHAARGTPAAQDRPATRIRSASSRWANRSSWTATAAGPALPGVVRRVTATPGLEQGHGVAAEGRVGLHQLGQGHVALERVVDQAADHAVGLAERHPLLHQPLGQVDGGHRRAVGRLLHPVGVEGRPWRAAR